MDQYIPLIFVIISVVVSSIWAWGRVKIIKNNNLEENKIELMDSFVDGVANVYNYGKDEFLSIRELKAKQDGKLTATQKRIARDSAIAYVYESLSDPLKKLFNSLTKMRKERYVETAVTKLKGKAV